MRRRDSVPKSRVLTFGLALLGVIAFVMAAAVLESQFAIPFDVPYRIACAGMCLVFIGKLAWDYPNERWPRIALSIALIVTIALFFTPIVDHPESRGELMIFALPDAVIVLLVRIASYPVTDQHQRAMRQQMILALIVAIVGGIVLMIAALGIGQNPA